MQQYHADASGYIKSLDDIYYFWGHYEHKIVAMEAHVPRSSKEIELLPGDQISIKETEWNSRYSSDWIGYSKGKNERSMRVGLYPSYKVEEVVRIAKMPTYPEADRDNHTESWKLIGESCR